MIVCLLLINLHSSSAGQTFTNVTHLPLVSHNLGGWLGPFGGSIIVTVLDPSNPQLAYTANWDPVFIKARDITSNQNSNEVSFSTRLGKKLHSWTMLRCKSALVI